MTKQKHICRITIDGAVTVATIGMEVTDFRGDKGILKHWDGRRVYVRYPRAEYDRELIPSVINAEIQTAS